MKLKDFARREYLRGFIIGSSKSYTLSTLLKKYREYLKHNPSVKKEIFDLNYFNKKK